ncbi:hypothetical protein MXB_5119 [Myxobolus squamalis]|nr:hypothetical protein MXB_5119 [Myxobolus squamalis]
MSAFRRLVQFLVNPYHFPAFKNRIEKFSLLEPNYNPILEKFCTNMNDHLESAKTMLNTRYNITLTAGILKPNNLSLN